MWISILAILASVLAWCNRTFSTEAKLRRREVAEAERKGRERVEAERLTRTYERIDQENKRSADEMLDRLKKLFGRR